MGISINGPSGIDTAWIIDSLVAIEYQKVERVESQKSAYQVKIDAYAKLLSFINDIGKSANNLQKEEDFNLFATSSSNEDIVSLSAGIGGVAGSYNVGVFQTAQREKIISSDKLITSQTEKLSDLGIAPGSFTINGVQIDIDIDDTIQDVRLKINTATDEDGNKSGVTATVLKVADDNFRLILSASDTGSEGVEYKDIDGGTFLQDLGIINNADGDKGIIAQKLQSTDDINSAFSALSVGELIEYGGIDHFGNEVSNSFLVTASSTIDDFLAQITDTFHGMVDVAIDDVDGTLIITDKSAGRSELEISSFNMGGTDHTIDRVEIGYTDQNVLSEGKDAFFSVDGINMQSEKNIVSGFISGVTLELHKASLDEIVTVEMNRDYDAITDKVDELLNSFNALVRYVNDSTKYGNVEEDEAKGTLAGDMTARMILSQVRALFHKNFNVSDPDDYTASKTFARYGLKTDTNNGEFELDKSAFKEALEESFDDVIGLFITKGYSDSPNIVLGNYSDDTSDGVYTLTENVDGIHYDIQLGSGTLFTSEPRIGDIVSFKEGPATGLTLTSPSGSGNALFTFSRGLSGHLDLLVKKLTNGYDGVIAIRQQSWTKAQERCDDRIWTLEARVEAFRMRLVKQFAAMEQTLNRLNSQSANMMAQLGFYTQ